MRMRTLIFCFSFGLALASDAAPAHRRAVLVGINDYTASELRAQPHLPTPPGRDWPNLGGAVNDVMAMKEMLVLLYGFDEHDIVVLTNQKATRDAIFHSLEQHLARPAAKDDVLLFYFAGHGSQVRNSLSDEDDKLDESLLPADSRLGVPDIRDKELRPIFNRILDRGAQLNVILDNCHSGSGARGQTTGDRLRGVNADRRDVADRSNAGPRPEDRGALVLSATQDSDNAWETRDDEKKMHGVFSWAWIRAMRDSTAGEPAAETFARASARMRAERPYQEPVFAASAAMSHSPFLGIRKDRSANRTVIGVEKVRRDGTVILQGGWANGLAVGSELRVLNDRATTVRIAITAIHGLGQSEGRIPPGQPMPAAIRSGALMEVVGWAAPAGRPLRVWMPRVSDDVDAIAALARKLAAETACRGVRWIDDPFETPPSWLLRRGNRGWELVGSDGLEHFGPDASDAIAAISKIRNGSSVFVQFPAPAALIGAIEIGPASDREGIDPADRPEEADYILAGRYTNGRLGFAWMRPAVKSAGRRRTGLPLSTPWIVEDARDNTLRDTAFTLRAAVLRLRKIHAWQLLDSPPEARSPYRLGIRRARDGQWAKSAVTGGEKYALFLRAGTALRAGIQPRFIYIFTIDSHGQSTLLFPRQGSVENRFPLPPGPIPPSPPTEISLGVTGTFEIGPPYGIDTYFLLTTDEPLPNPWILEWDGVRAGAQSALEELLLLTASGSRAHGRATPANWSIERVSFESIAPRGAKS